jgi:hypothetical protein
MLSGILICCMGKPRLAENKSSSNLGQTFFTNLVVGICQLSTIFLLLVGWFWSVAWGFYLVIIASELKYS